MRPGEQPPDPTHRVVLPPRRPEVWLWTMWRHSSSLQFASRARRNRSPIWVPHPNVSSKVVQQGRRGPTPRTGSGTLLLGAGLEPPGGPCGGPARNHVEEPGTAGVGDIEDRRGPLLGPQPPHPGEQGLISPQGGDLPDPIRHPRPRRGDPGILPRPRTLPPGRLGIRSAVVAPHQPRRKAEHRQIRQLHQRPALDPGVLPAAARGGCATRQTRPGS
jgi:hypothetical protein